MKKFIVILVVSFLFGGLVVSAQDSEFEAYKKAYKADFEMLVKGTQKPPQTISEDSVPHKFKNKNDSLFYEFLKGEWKTFKVEYMEAPMESKLLFPPVADSADIANHKGIEIFPINVHPECRDDEMFLENISSEYVLSETEEFLAYPNKNATQINFNKIGWETKRLGRTAYDIDWNIIEGMVPVFIKISEFDKN